MPEHRSYRGREVKNAKRIVINGRPFIKVTFAGVKGEKGEQELITPKDYEAGLRREFYKGSKA